MWSIDQIDHNPNFNRPTFCATRYYTWSNNNTNLRVCLEMMVNFRLSLCCGLPLSSHCRISNPECRWPRRTFPYQKLCKASEWTRDLLLILAYHWNELLSVESQRKCLSKQVSSIIILGSCAVASTATVDAAHIGNSRGMIHRKTLSSGFTHAV